MHKGNIVNLGLVGTKFVTKPNHKDGRIENKK